MSLADVDPVYAHAGVSLLASQPSEVSTKPPSTDLQAKWVQLLAHLNQRISGLRAWRFSWWQHWALLARYILPRRFLWFSGNQPNANSMVRGSAINESIVDPTGTQAMRICSAGMMSGLSSPSRPWFKLKIGLPGIELDAAAQDWFDIVEDRMYEVMSRSNFYDSLAQQIEDLVVFGTAPMIIYEDDTDIIRCYNPCAGEYYLASSSAFRVETLGRQFLLNISQIVEMFTLERCPVDVQGLWKAKGANLETERVIAHVIEPNFSITLTDGEEYQPVDAEYPWREVYWVYGSGGLMPLSACGFHEQPHVAPRWAVQGNDAYGRSPGMDALPDIMQLQQETKRKAEGIEKLVRPPLVADAVLKNQPSSSIPGGVTYVANLGQSTGMRPLYQVQPELREMMEDLKEIQLRIKSGFFNDIFLMVASATKDETAYEVAKKYEEKLQVLGPIIERQYNENHSPAIKRVFRIMERKNLLPPIPPSLHGIPIGIEYVSILALAQRATATAAMEGVVKMLGALEGVFPDAKDNVDSDELLREYGDLTSVKPKIFRDKAAVAQMRQQRAKDQASRQAAAAMPQMAETAQTMANTPIGSGRSVLDAVLGSQGAPQGNA